MKAVILRHIVDEWDALIQEKTMLREGLEVLFYDLECRIWRVCPCCLGKLSPEFLTLLKRLKKNAIPFFQISSSGFV